MVDEGGGLDGCIEGDGVPSKTNSLFKILPYNDDKCFDMLTKDIGYNRTITRF